MLTELSNQMADAIAAAAPAVVQVQGRRRPASGLVYGDGVVVTTMRAIGREDGLVVRSHDGQACDAELAGWDPSTTIAVLRVAGLAAPGIAPSPNTPRVGQLALALARSWSNAVTASAGIVSVIGGPLRTGRRHAIEQVLRTSAPMHDGFSGGAFLDAAGGLVGMTTATAIRGLGVVIPAPLAWRAAAHVLEHGRTSRGYLGIVSQEVALPEHQREGLDRENGLLVLAVAPGSPAAAAGVLVGDVLTALDERAVASPDDVLDALTGTPAGRAAVLKLLRGGKVMNVAVTVGERPAR
jgi:S1-C subfamily serine protease